MWAADISCDTDPGGAYGAFLCVFVCVCMCCLDDRLLECVFLFYEEPVRSVFIS